MPSCCVVGATGYVGAHVTRELLRKGYAVRATCRNPDKAQWLKDLVPGGDIELHAVTMTPEGFPVDSNPLDKIVAGCKGVFMCAGYEKQEPATIDFMVNAGQAVLNAAAKYGEPICVVLCSSGGSTNPPGAAPDALKNELHTWSDPDAQKANKRFSPAAKTLMEIAALKFVGRNQQNQVVDQEKGKTNVRLCIMNPNGILGPQLQPGEISGNGLPGMARIIKGERMSEKIPNDSMSFIHVEDLALLHIACMENSTASGRYFGVNRSWHWEDIFATIQQQYPAFKMPPKTYESQNPVTRFNNERRDSLGVSLKPLEVIFGDTIKFLIEKGALASE